MAASNRYKLAKISAPLKNTLGLFDKPSTDPGQLISEAILKNPQMPGDVEGEVRWAIFNAKRIDENILEGDFTRQGTIEWPHISEDILTQDQLAAHPFCHFYYDAHTQLAAFQSARMNKSFPGMLNAWDELLKGYVDQHGRYPHSLPVVDETPFLTSLRNATRIFSITFDMIPPNGYTRSTVRDTLAYISEATDAREVAIKIDAGRGGSINPGAKAVQEMTAECAEGNGSAKAPILDSAGNSKTVSTREAPVVRKLAGIGVENVRKLLRWVNDKAGV